MATKRLIDLDELLKHPIRKDNYDREHGNVHFINGIESIIEYAEDLPIVDAVEVVRCKDCKHYYWEQEPYHGRTCRFCRLHKVIVDKDTFCSHGERREQ